MYYKKQGNVPPVIKSGCVYHESYFYDLYLFFKYSSNNFPSEEMEEITQEEYELNRPVNLSPVTQEVPLSPTEQALIQTAITTEYMAALMETTI